MDSRLRAICEMQIPSARENAGLHEYDGQIQDLSPDGVRSALAALGGPPLPDPHDEAHLSTFENAARLEFGELQLYRSNPLLHAENLDLSGYDRPYAPAAELAETKRRHLAQWPDAVDMAIEALDRVPAPVARSLIDAIRGLAVGIDDEPALAAHARLVAHVQDAADHGEAETAIGADALARLMGTPEALTCDLGVLASRADAERERLMARLREACARIDADAKPIEIVQRLVSDHPDADGVLAEARDQVTEVLAFTRDNALVPYVDGECLVEVSPPSRRWAMAMMGWNAPAEPDGPSYYWVTPPDPSWPTQEADEWLQVFSRATLPAVTLHEVSPGHFAHGRALRRAPTPVRRTLQSVAFCEGWAHYVEELSLDEGFRAGDVGFAVGICVEALVRVTRLACAIGVHTGAMTVDDAARRFEADAFLAGPAALSEARRATFDPGYGCYTWGKLAIRDLQARAREMWGGAFTLSKFHAELLTLGAPPLGLMEAALG